jgi:hypothetical protein
MQSAVLPDSVGNLAESEMRVAAALLTASLLLVAPALPAVATTEGAAAAEKLDPKDPNYLRCRKIAVTGSLVKKERICKTNAEWAKAMEETQRNADDLITRNRTGTNGQ